MAVPFQRNGMGYYCRFLTKQVELKVLYSNLLLKSSRQGSRDRPPFEASIIIQINAPSPLLLANLGTTPIAASLLAFTFCFCVCARRQIILKVSPLLSHSYALMQRISTCEHKCSQSSQTQSWRIEMRSANVFIVTWINCCVLGLAVHEQFT